MTLFAWSFFAFFVFLATYAYIQDGVDLLLKRRRDINTDRPMAFLSATISFDLVPLISQLNLDGATIRILGHDGAYLASKNSLARLFKGWYFERSIKRWIEKGAIVEYLLLDPEPRHEAHFLAMQTRLGERFVVGKLGTIKVKDREIVAEILARFETLHPTLIETTTGSAYWVEYNHPKGSTVAFATKFVSPRALADPSEKEEFDIYNRQLQKLRDYTIPIAA